MRFTIVLAIGLLAMYSFAEGAPVKDGAQAELAELAEPAEPAPEDREAGKHYDSNSFISAKFIFVFMYVTRMYLWFIFALF